MKKIYVKACQNCDRKVTAHTISRTIKGKYLLKCGKCGVENTQTHTATFLRNREVLI